MPGAKANEIRLKTTVRARQLFDEHRAQIYCQTDRVFAVLMALQWIAGVIAAMLISPREWAGVTSIVHPHVWAALMVGFVTSALPIVLVFLKPGEAITRHVIAVAQMLSSALLIHISGGRIETHFHVFGSLAFLALYRDWKVLVSATLVVAADHFWRGCYFPQSVFGVLNSSNWRWVEHAGWVLFEDIILIKSCLRGVEEMRGIAERQAKLEISFDIERKVQELELANARAEAEARAKDAFLATMSHEIRTPMNAILGMNRLLLTSTLSAEQREYAETVQQSGEALLTIINDILDFSKIQAGRLLIEPIPFNLNLTVEEAVELFGRQAIGSKVEVLLRYAPDAPRTVVGDPGRIRQVLLNLIGNAVKFTPEGHVLVEVDCSERTKHDALIRISVTDTGIGIAEEQIGLLFREFSQADASTTRKFGGTGLGLAICKRLVELMGGSIKVSSRPGKGSTFAFSMRLPLSGSSSLLQPCSRRELRSARLLIVDDTKLTREILSEHLTGSQLRHSCTSSEDEAIALMLDAVAADDPFHLVIIDLRTSGENGEELGRRIKLNALLNKTSLMLLTGFGQKGDRTRFENASFSAYLTKPIRTQHLVDALALMWGAQLSGVPLPGIITRHSLAEARAVEAEKNFVETGSMPRFLIAEDNAVNQKLICRLLEKAGCTSELARNGRECVEMWNGSHYDTILMDCQMPELDGWQATMEIRRQEQSKEASRKPIPIFALTANAMQSDREKCLNAGMDGFITKPIQKEDLLNVIEDVIQTRDSSLA